MRIKQEIVNPSN